MVYVARALESHIEHDAGPGEAGDALIYYNRAWHRLNKYSKLAL